MKRYCIGLAVMAVLFFSCASASVLNTSKTYVFTNDNAHDVIEFVSTSTIIPGIHKILSVTVIPSRVSAYSPNVALYDATASYQMSEGNILGENEAPANQSKEKPFEYPKALAHGLGLAVGPYTTVIVDYAR